MDAESIKVIIFDLGGVVLDWNPRNLYRRYFDKREEMEAFLSEIDFASWNAQQDKGRPFAEGVAVLSARFPHRAALIRAYHEHWEESVSGPIEATVRLVRQLKDAGYPLFALSNWSAETFPIARHKYDCLQLFDAIIVSGEVGLIKPDPAIFELAVKRSGVVASECLFIDDHGPNIAVAQQLGMQAIHFRSADGLADELRSLVHLEDEIERRLGSLLADMHSRRAWSSLGYASLGHYAEERLGLARRTLEQRAELARSLSPYPELREAYESGRMGVEATALVRRGFASGRVDSQLEHAWTEHASQVTVKLFISFSSA